MPDPVLISFDGLPQENRDTVTGDTRRIWITVEHPDPQEGSSRVDPETLSLEVRDGEGTVTTPKLTQEEVEAEKVPGRYYADLSLATEGTWAVRAEASGDYLGVAEASFYVRPSAFT